MTNPTPELLKLVAEYMGYHHLSQHEGKVLIDVLDPLAGWGAEPDYMEYNPLTNAEQCLELWAKITDTPIEEIMAEVFDQALSHITATQGED